MIYDMFAAVICMAGIYYYIYILKSDELYQ